MSAFQGHIAIYVNAQKGQINLTQLGIDNIDIKRDFTNSTTMFVTFVFQHFKAIEQCTFKLNLLNIYGNQKNRELQVLDLHTDINWCYF